MIVSISYPKASDHFADVGKMVKIGSNYGEYATFKPVDFDGFKPLEIERFKTTATPQLEP